MGLIRYHIKNLRKFDEITRFRLQLLALVLIMEEIIIPVLSQYYYLLKIGPIEAATIIGIFSLLKKIGIKIVKYIMNNFSFSNIFLMVMIFDFLWATASISYFYSPKIMVWLDSIIGLFHLPFIIAFSNSLNNYMMYFYSEKFTIFQNYKNDIIAEAGIVGIIISILATAFHIGLAVSIFIFGMYAVLFFQIKVFKKFKKYDFKYMYNYIKNTKGK